MSDFSGGLHAAADAVLAAAADLNRLDAQAGDGDLGVTMSLAARTLLEMLPELAERPLSDALRDCGAALARKTPSTSGTLIATALLRASRAATDEPESPSTAALLEAASTGVAERGKAEPGSKTMLDALAPAASAAAESRERGGSNADQLRAAAEAAKAGAQATVSMVPRHGRAGWLADRSAGHEDGGARLVAIVLTAVSEHTSELAAS